VPWVSPLLYGAVLLAGGYAGLAGLGETRPALFVGGLAALFCLDFAERRRYPVRTPPGQAVALLAARLGLFLAVAAADGSGMSRVLFLLLPFTAYFAFGGAASIAIGAGSVALVAVSFQLTVPGWYRQAEQVSDLLMFSIGLVLTIAMAAVAVEERRGRARLAELSGAAERNRLARDIHDGLGHHLTAIIVLLEKATAFRGRAPETAQRAVEDAHRSARKALDDVRRSVRALHAGTEPFRLSAALDELVREAGVGGPSVTLHCAGDEDGLDPDAQLALYRAAQEGITNARRHSGAGRVAVSLRVEDAHARLTVADDGCGFPPDRAGFGLLGMRERVRLAGGSVEVDSGPTAGTRLTVTIPRVR
jgi:signal transduction histidine kinase